MPFGEERKLSTLLRRLESETNTIVALEMTSLEDAYLKIVKAESGGDFKDDDQIQNEYIMQKY